jgi:hypothetical protein
MGAADGSSSIISVSSSHSEASQNSTEEPNDPESLCQPHTSNINTTSTTTKAEKILIKAQRALAKSTAQPIDASTSKASASIPADSVHCASSHETPVADISCTVMQHAGFSKDMIQSFIASHLHAYHTSCYANCPAHKKPHGTVHVNTPPQTLPLDTNLRSFIYIDVSDMSLIAERSSELDLAVMLFNYGLAHQHMMMHKLSAADASNADVDGYVPSPDSDKHKSYAFKLFCCAHEVIVEHATGQVSSRLHATASARLCEADGGSLARLGKGVDVLTALLINGVTLSSLHTLYMCEGEYEKASVVGLHVGKVCECVIGKLYGRNISLSYSMSACAEWSVEDKSRLLMKDRVEGMTWLERSAAMA